jgi:hypothetical protein
VFVCSTNVYRMSSGTTESLRDHGDGGISIGDQQRGKGKEYASTNRTRQSSSHKNTSYSTWAATVSVGFLLLWAVSLLSGAVLYYNDTRRHPLSHATLYQSLLRGFESVFKRAGSLFVPIAWSVRVFMKLIIHGSTRNPSQGIQKEHLWLPGLVYAVQGMLRGLVYKLHVAWTATQENAEHIMSDHVFLGSCIMIGIATEVYILLTSNIMQSSSIVRWKRQLLVAVVGSVVVFMWILLLIQVHHTARYHHSPKESLIGAVIGIVLFSSVSMVFLYNTARQVSKTKKSF